MQSVRKGLGKQRDLPQGVYPSGKKWVARIDIKGKHKHLGTFATPEEASAAFEAAKQAKRNDRFEEYMRRYAEQGCPQELIDGWREQWRRDQAEAAEAEAYKQAQEASR